MYRKTGAAVTRRLN